MWIYCDCTTYPLHHSTFVLLVFTSAASITLGFVAPLAPDVASLALFTSKDVCFLVHLIGLIIDGPVSCVSILGNIVLSAAVLAGSITCLVTYICGKIEYESCLWASYL